MTSNTGLSTSGSTASPGTQPRGMQPSAGGRREGPQIAPCPTSTSNRNTTLHTCFYFTVFFSNNPPIFHSNRIPANLLGIAPASASSACSPTAPCTTGSTTDGDGDGDGDAAAAGVSPGARNAPAAYSTPPSLCTACRQRRWRSVFCDPADLRNTGTGVSGGPRSSAASPTEGFDAADLDDFCVGDFRCEAAAVDEVPQQTLQTVAFPTTFGSGVGGGACPLPTRTLGRRPRRPSRSTPPLQQASSSVATTKTAQPPAASAPSASPMQLKGRASHKERAAEAEKEKEEEVLLMGSGLRSSNASFLLKQASTTSTSPSQCRQPQRQPNTTQHQSPNTLPLTTTASTNVTTSSTETAFNATTTTVASVIPARFQPTFPSVKWEDEEDGGTNDGRAGPKASTDVKGTSWTNTTTTTTTTSTEKQNALAGTPAPASATLGCAPVRTRRPRPKVSSESTAASQSGIPAAHQQASPSFTPPHQVEGGDNIGGGGRSSTSSAPNVQALTLVPNSVTPVSSLATSATPAAANATAAAAATSKQVPSTLNQGGGVPRPSPSPVEAITSASAAPDTTVNVTPAAITQEGPPWSMRVEEVRSAKGELRYYRVILAVSFAALITSHTGMMHSMQTRNAATALVLTCPPCGTHYRFFLHHIDVLRSALNRTTEFAIRTVQRFFGLLFSPTQKPKGTQQQVLKGITNRLEMHSEACETYRAVKAELANALGVRYPLPLLAPSASGWVVPVLIRSSLVSMRARVGSNGKRALGGSGASAAMRTKSDARSGCGGESGGRHRSLSGASAAMSWLGVGRSGSSSSSATTAAVLKDNVTTQQQQQQPPPPPLSDILCDATAFLCDYSEGFASAFVCGLLSLLDDGVGRRKARLHVHALATPVDAGAAHGSAPPPGQSHLSTTRYEDTSLPLTGTSARVGESTLTTGDVAGNTRDASCAYPALTGIDTTTPDWLSAYGSYFDAASINPDRACSRDTEDPCGNGETDGWVRLSRLPKPSETIALHNQERSVEDACVGTHVSASTVSSLTPELSPLTVDVSTRSPSARLPRGRNLSAPSSTSNSTLLHLEGIQKAQGSRINPTDCTNGLSGVANTSWAALQTPTTAQLYAVSPETSTTSHAMTSAMSGTSSPQYNAAATTNAYNSSGGELANLSGLSRPQTSLMISAMTSVVAAPLLHTTNAAAAASATTPAPSVPSLSAASPATQQQKPNRPPTTPAPSPTGREDEFVLHRGRLGRVIIFTQDAMLARRLLVLAAFVWSDCTESGAMKCGASASSSPSLSLASASSAAARATTDRGVRGVPAPTWSSVHCEDAQRMYETAVAAAVSSADFANVPIQWVAEEFSEARLTALCSRFSPENTLLVVVPRQLQCRRVSLRKHVAGTTVLVEQQAGREVRIRSPAFPFRCAMTKQTVLLPDPTVTTLLREARSLHQGSRGTVDFAEVFQRMVAWLYWQSAAAVLKKRDADVYAATAATAAAPCVEESVGGGEGGLSRYTSADLLWPSRSVSAMNSHTATPTLATPVAVLSSFPRVHAAASSTVSASPCSPAMTIGRSWTADSAEESLLPGSRGGASTAWAYTTSANSTANHPDGATHIVNGGGGGHSTNALNAASGIAPTTSAAAASGVGGASGTSPAHITSTLLVSHGLLQPPSAFVTASPTTATTPQRSSSLRFFRWFKSSPTSAAATPHHHPILSPTALHQLSAADGGQLPRLLTEDEELMHAGQCS